MSHVKVIDGNQQLKTFNIRLFHTHVDYYVPLDLGGSQEPEGTILDIHVNGQYRNDGGVASFTCWKNMKSADSFDMTNTRAVSSRLSSHSSLWMDERP